MSKPLKIAITNPFRWPHVRRGSERVLHDLGSFLSSKGHLIETYSLGPEHKKWIEDGVHHTTFKAKFGDKLRQFNQCHYFAFTLSSALKEVDVDIVHCLNYFDAYAAITARRKYDLSYKVVFHAVGIPTARYFRAVPLDSYFFKQTLKHADAVWSLSEFARSFIKQDFAIDSNIFPPPVFVDKPEVTDVKDEGSNIDAKKSPHLLFVGDCVEARKGASLLIEALQHLPPEFTNINVVFSGNVTKEIESSLIAALPNNASNINVRFLGKGKIEDLPSLYEQADICVLPSVWEAFGLVVVESLAQGTPVVACRHGGVTDIVDSSEIGQLFEPGEFTIASTNAIGLAQAIVEVWKSLSSGKIDHHKCKLRAYEFSWDQLGSAYINAYQELANGS